jgi:hypothetical protein
MPYLPISSVSVQAKIAKRYEDSEGSGSADDEGDDKSKGPEDDDDDAGPEASDDSDDSFEAAPAGKPTKAKKKKPSPKKSTGGEGMATVEELDARWQSVELKDVDASIAV